MRKEYTVFVTAMRGKERLTANVVTRAENSQAAILQVVGISAKGISWYSWTYRNDVGYVDDAEIVAYEVGHAA